MFQRIGWAVVAAGAFSVTTPLRAAGNPNCYTSGAFAACASAVIGVNHSLGAFKLMMQNLNLGGRASYYINGLGVYYTAPPSYSGNVTWSPGALTWRNGPGPTLRGGIASTNRLGAPQSSRTTGSSSPRRVSTRSLGGYGPHVFAFGLSNGANFGFNGWMFGPHGSQTAQLNSPGPGPGQGQSQGPGGHTGSLQCSASQNCVTVTPEPATMGLLAVGLVGLVGVSLIRRRRSLARA